MNRKLLAIKNQNWKNDIVNVKVLRGLSEIRKSASCQGSKKSVKLAYVDFLAMFEKKTLVCSYVYIFERFFLKCYHNLPQKALCGLVSQFGLYFKFQLGIFRRKS